MILGIINNISDRGPSLYCFGTVAQRLVHLAHNENVIGSNPIRPTKPHRAYNTMTTRYVVENAYGILHIFSEKNLKLMD